VSTLARTSIDPADPAITSHASHVKEQHMVDTDRRSPTSTRPPVGTTHVLLPITGETGRTTRRSDPTSQAGTT
jgi:hypothetical protein